MSTTSPNGQPLPAAPGDQPTSEARDVAPGEPPAPDDVMAALASHGVTGVATDDEVTLRRLLEAHMPSYTLYRLPPAAARRWKCRYRIMFGATYLDCQSATEAYARALLAALS